MTNLAKLVTYVNEKGNQKAALVIATPETTTEGTSLIGPAAGTVSLIVFSPTGNIYPRANVATKALFDQMKAGGEVPEEAAGPYVLI